MKLWFLLLCLFFVPTLLFTNPVQGAESPSKDSETEALVRPVLPPKNAAKTSGADSSSAKTTPSGVDKTITLGDAQDDARIRATLNHLVAQAGWFPEIKTSVEQGVVVITGRAKKQEHLEWLAKAADRLPQVIAVINRAEVEIPAVSDFTPAKKEFQNLIEKGKKALPLIVVALLLFMLFFFVAKALSRGVENLWGRSIKNPFLLSTVVRVTMLPIWVLFIFLTLQTAGLSSLASTLIGGTGALGIVMGFAFKDIAQNYIAGLLLAMRSPFTKGDEIQVNNFEGYVQSLNMRGTEIVDFDGNMVLIPNALVINSIVRNRTSHPATRNSFIVGIGYEDSIQEAQRIIYDVLKSVSEVLPDPAPNVVVNELAASTVNLRIMYYFDSVKSSKNKVQSKAITGVKESLLAAGITMPGGIQDIRVLDPMEITLQRKSELTSGQGNPSSSTSQERLEEKAEEQIRDRQRYPDEIEEGGSDRDVEKLADRSGSMVKATDSKTLKI